ncbi:MAG: response regulator [Verrucomicrobia bacterium]|nr:response regulator [Verrucomicrobiota bacterium]
MNPQPDSNSETLIYVVDDEPILLELATFILEPLGYRLKTFRDPDAAFEAFRSADHPPQLLITDYAMHQMNGLELLRKCKTADPKLKTLLVSGTVGEDIYRDSTIKPDKFLAKPYHANQLSDLVELLLRK